MKRTVTIQIGNSDDKLSQSDWSQFVRAISNVIHSEMVAGVNIHFHGLSAGDAPWQNACWVIECDLNLFGVLMAKIEEVRQRYKQDSVAWTEGVTQFV